MLKNEPGNLKLYVRALFEVQKTRKACPVTLKYKTSCPLRSNFTYNGYLKLGNPKKHVR
jgi:hypothetical protein